MKRARSEARTASAFWSSGEAARYRAEGLALFVSGCAGQDTGDVEGDLAGAQGRADVRDELEELEAELDGSLGDAERLGDLRGAHAVLVAQLGEGFRLVEGLEARALEVLDQGGEERIPGLVFADDRRECPRSRRPRRARRAGRAPGSAARPR